MESNKNDASVAEATRELLNQKPFLKELMDMDAVNYRGLARYFKENVEEKTGRDSVNLDSIVMAIRRFEKDSSVPEGLMEIIKDTLEKSELTMKSDINYYTFQRTKEIEKKIMKAHEAINNSGKETLYIMQAESEIAIIFDQKNIEKVEKHLNLGKAKNIAEDLDMVIMDSPDKIRRADGILSHITEKIIANGIGLTEMMTTYTETVFLVEEENGPKLYQVLKDLKA